jgi:hypothetical protein
MMMSTAADWDDSPGWMWRARRLLNAYDCTANLPESPAGFARMPDGALMGLTSWPTDFTAETWREVTDSVVSLARQFT